MEIRQLKYFVAAVRHRTILRAAKDQNITQPALTRSIRKLEQELGGLLLERTPRGVVPTELGRAFFERACSIVNEAERARDEVSALKSGSIGQVSIGVSSNFAGHYLIPALVRLFETHRQINITVREGLFETLTPQLRAGEVDFVFSVFPSFYEEPDLVYEQIMEIRSPIVARRQHPLARGTVTREDLSKAAWVLLEQRHVERFHEQFFAKHKLPYPRFRLKTNSLVTMIEMMQRADLIALLPEYLIADALTRGAMVKVPYRTGTLSNKAGLVFMPHRKLSTAATIAVSQIRTVCRAKP
ncbi:MAG: LysR family transcriptional regulator [Rhodospirillaceae bacterium]|nr:LysR family transcriptional regulator [Rhodospirillaceae bacterium]